MKKTKIVCTIGPATEQEEVLKNLILAGMNVARINFSHGSHEEHQTKIDLIKKVREELKEPVAIMLDTKGPEIRTLDFENGEITLEAEQAFIITTREVLGNKDICGITYKNLPNDVKLGDRILIDDGLIGLKVIEITNDTDILCVVENPGVVKNKKGVNVPSVQINLPALTEKDIADIKFGIKNGIDFIAASFIRKPTDVLEIRKILEENNADGIQIISKIENEEGVENIDDIIELSDGIMVARGDLGVEIPAEDVPLVQKMIIQKCNISGKPVITATQMLESMIKNPRPTRAEVTDVANAILDGTDAIMLSGETAIGKYPLGAVETMSRIAKKIEDSESYKNRFAYLRAKNIAITNAISHATGTIAMDLGVKAILTATSSGYTARSVSKFRPDALIIAATPSREVMRKLALVWGVYSVYTETMSSTDDAIEGAVYSALQSGYLKQGELVVITAGIPVGVVGGTNMIKVHVVGDILLKGTGLGKKPAVGRVCIANSPEEARGKFQDGDILVSIDTDKDMVEFMQKSSAILTERGGLTSHAAVVGITIGKPVIVGIRDVTTVLKDGDIITVDTDRGLVFKGKANIL